jgi:regulator of RNase E activity RraA
MNFPTFGFGSYGQDSGPRYKVHDFRVPIEIGGVSIRSGDILFGDIDGVCVIPTNVEHEVFARAIEKVHKENVAKRDLESGVTAASAYEVHQVM